MSLIFLRYKWEKHPLWVLFFFCLLAATAIIVTTTTVVATIATRAAAAEEDKDKNDYPRAVISTEVTHFLDLLCLFSSHTMLKEIKVLHSFKK